MNKIYNKFSLKNLPEDAKIHFIALGGIGMSALARILQQAGYKISGSDLTKNHLMEYFEQNGADVYVGHAADNLKDCYAVVKSTAIKDDNPEYRKALENGIPVLHRSELLNALMTDLGQKAIGVTGTHGKTSTTGMIATVLHESGMKPGFAIGGEIPHLKTNSAYGEGEYFVSELDESDGTIELYSPEVCVITNLEFEHADHYKDGFEQLLSTFDRFAAQAPHTKMVINIDDAGNLEFMERNKGSKFITYSLKDKDADYYAETLAVVPEARMNIYKKGKFLGEATVGVPGEHNVSNGLGAAAACLECGVNFEKISSALAKFTGMKKRFQTVGIVNGARLIDDYAHHPTEIKATIETTKKLTALNGNGRVIAVFQPHRYTRLANLWDDFLKCFDSADLIYVCDVYSAEEPPIDGVNSKIFSQKLEKTNVHYIPGSLDVVAERLLSDITVDDIVLTMGAGTITKLGPMIVEKSGGNI